MTTYKQALIDAMTMLAEDPRVIFLGQGVAYPGTYMSETLEGVPMERRTEMPVAEEMQLGLSIGMAMEGFVPVSIFPRWNFLLLAANQLVNHLDKIKPQPKVIVRVGVGSTRPLYPGEQHDGDFTDAFGLMLRYTPIVRVRQPEAILPAYQTALEANGATVIVEEADLYHDD